MTEMDQLSSSGRKGQPFIIVPTIVSFLTENPYEFRLWCLVEELCGLENGECTVTTEDLAVLGDMSVADVEDARRGLIEKGLLEGYVEDKGNGDSSEN